MATITLEVSEENLGSVITVLTNLKENLIETMDVQSTTSLKQTPQPSPTRYQPKTQRVIKEEEQGSLERRGKYISPSEFKKKLYQSK